MAAYHRYHPPSTLERSSTPTGQPRRAVYSEPVKDRGQDWVDSAHARLLKAFTHPLRAAILGRLDEAVLSPKELADDLDAPLSVVSYHVKELARLELIELVRTKPRRGAVQHWYRSKLRGVVSRREFETDEQGFAELAATLTHALERIERIEAEAGRRLRESDAPGRHATVSVMLLDGSRFA